MRVKPFTFKKTIKQVREFRGLSIDLTYDDAESILDHLLHTSHVYGDSHEVILLKDHLRTFLGASRAVKNCESPPLDPNK